MKWLIGLLCLFFLVIFHEFGHFIFAKLFGVKVESFSVGFGPVLFHKTIKGTDYRFSAIPLGGYCGMKGENDFRKAVDEKLPEIIADPDSFYGVHPVKRALIAFAGPFFNFIFALFCCICIAKIGYKYYTLSNKIIVPDVQTQKESPARDAGLQTGDLIVEIDGTEITDFSELVKNVSLKADKDIKVVVERNGERIEYTVHSMLDKESGRGLLGVIVDNSEIVEKHTPYYTFFGAIKQGFLDTINSAVTTIKSFRILFKGIDLQKALDGPIRVTNIIGSTVKEGFSDSIKIGLISMMEILSIISISLFIMNLLPIPVLDGEIILISLIEIIIRRKINPRIQYYIQFVGFAIIAFLFIIGFTGDISFLVSGGAK